MENVKNIKLKILIKGNDRKTATLEDLFPLLDFNKYLFEYSETPDYLIHDQLLREDFTKYDCVRIAYEGERHTPDFNLSDYAISDDILDFGDRYYNMPQVARRMLRHDFIRLKNIELKEYTKEDLDKKDYFCNFIYSNELANGMRSTLFDLLSQYKKVHSGGKMKNNIGHAIPGGAGDTIHGTFTEKLKFQAKCKFSLAVENLSYPGYTTEKLLHAFEAETIPIYWGDVYANKIFNKNAYLDVNDFSSLDDLLNRVIELDSNDDMYLSMMNQRKINPLFTPELLERGMCKFIENIFDQPLAKANRRNHEFYTKHHENVFSKGLKHSIRNRKLNEGFSYVFKCLHLANTVLYRHLKRRRYYK